MISVFPGSRQSEIEVLAPILVDFIKLMNKKYNDFTFVFHSTKEYSELIQSYLKFDELKNMTLDQVNSIVMDLKKESFNLRFQKANGQLENTSRVKVVKRSVARVFRLINNVSNKKVEK